MDNIFKKLLKKNNRERDFYSQSVNERVSKDTFKYNEEIAIIRKTLKQLTELHPDMDFSEFNAYFARVESIKEEVKKEIEG